MFVSLYNNFTSYYNGKCENCVLYRCHKKMQHCCNKKKKKNGQADRQGQKTEQQNKNKQKQQQQQQQCNNNKTSHSNKMCLL